MEKPCGRCSKKSVMRMRFWRDRADKILATLDPLASMAELDSDAWTGLIEGIDSDLPEFRALLAELNPKTNVLKGLTDEDAVGELPPSFGNLGASPPRQQLSRKCVVQTFLTGILIFKCSRGL